MRVGFAGLGRMGAHMARNLAAAGNEMVLWNRSIQKAVTLAEEIGCEFARTPVELVTETEVVITMLADDPSSEAVHLGPEGLFASRGARTFIEMGTMSPGHIADLAACAPEGVRTIDAPVSGSTQAAEAGELLIMAGCGEETVQLLIPLFDAMGRQTICLEKTGAGAVMKLAVNSLIHGINQTLAEAMTLAEASGIAAESAFDVIEASAACAPMLKYRRPLYLDEAAHEVTFTVALAQKDMAVTIALAEKLGVDMPQGQTTLKKLLEASEAGFANRDMAAMLNFMREKNK